MERASWFQFGLVGAVASGGGLMKRASCNSFSHWLHCCFMRGLMERYIQLDWLGCFMRGTRGASVSQVRPALRCCLMRSVMERALCN